MIFLLVFVTGFGLALALTPLAIRLAERTGAVALPDARRRHAKPMPRLGGLSLCLAFLGALGVSLLYPRTDPYEPARLIGLTFGCVLMFLVGAYDDYRELNAWSQLAAQVIAACIAIAAGVLINQVQSPFGGLILFDAWFAVPFTLFWLTGMMNTINWLDGLDGLAAGVVVIASGVMFIHSYRDGQYSISFLALALAGASLGFLPFNFFPARIFMGGGALVLGYALGTVSTIGGAKVATALLVLFIPILDVAWQIIARVRAGKSPYAADRGHLHFRLLDLGVPQRAIVLLYYVFTVIFGALALLLPLGVYKLIAMIVIGIGAVIALYEIARKQTTKKPRD
ncbi:MAG: undecaprenyl/decaprenyl-phosphate alpha-N-acetylglucosaminyl 1-phosphate transferase [Chloroflexi bacterium]|nr:undecaprenyl/decaprenyl-phosphate alpha-N-acetylglucosaminyl 1-phosphate transferase [Chloroflexota bacterium]